MEKVLGKIEVDNHIKRVLSLWGFEKELYLKEEDIDYETERQRHIWTVNEDYILKMTKNEYEMKNNIYIAKLLLREGIPAQRVINKLDRDEYACVGDRYYGLFTKLKGEVLKDYFEGDYLNRGFYLGVCIADLHRGLKNITNELKDNKDIWDNNMNNELSGWVREEVDKYITTCKLPKEDIEAFNKIYLEMNNNFEDIYVKLPRQVIHRDIHGENMIFQGEKLAGYIDFDLSQINARIYDVCYLCTGSLASVFDNIDKREKWLGFAKEVISGYRSKIDITIEEENSIKYIFYLIELIMVAYFAQNNYKDIADINIKMINWINLVWKS